MKRTFISILLLAAFFCSPNVVNAFGDDDGDAGLGRFCAAVGYKSLEKCLGSKEIARFKCEFITSAPVFWQNGLRPPLPLAVCSYGHQSPMIGIKGEGCMVQKQLTLLVARPSANGTEVVQITDKGELAAVFLPIDDKDEAISYASILVDAEPMYEFPKDYFQFSKEDKGKWIVKKPKPTTAELREDGWHVWLYYEPLCGCHPFELYQVEYLMNNIGTVSRLKEKKVWVGEGEICVD